MKVFILNALSLATLPASPAIRSQLALVTAVRVITAVASAPMTTLGARTGGDIRDRQQEHERCDGEDLGSSHHASRSWADEC